MGQHRRGVLLAPQIPTNRWAPIQVDSQDNYYVKLLVICHVSSQNRDVASANNVILPYCTKGLIGTLPKNGQCGSGTNCLTRTHPIKLGSVFLLKKFEYRNGKRVVNWYPAQILGNFPFFGNRY